jgi:hypothetical protein
MSGRLRVLLLLLALCAAILPDHPASARPLPQPIDADPANCTLASFSPAAANVPLLDPGDPIEVTLFMVGDRGVSEFRMIELVQQAQAAYEPLNIELKVVGSKEVTFEGNDEEQLFQQTKALFADGERPNGADAVLLVTRADLASSAGIADCVGGVEFPTTAFALVEDLVNRPDTGVALGPVTFVGKRAAKILAHELAHLLGAHHHYNDCAEGALTEIQELEASPCTLMFPTLDFISLGMGALEASVVRGYADLYARP